MLQHFISRVTAPETEIWIISAGEKVLKLFRWHWTCRKIFTSWNYLSQSQHSANSHDNEFNDAAATNIRSLFSDVFLHWKLNYYT